MTPAKARKMVFAALALGLAPVPDMLPSVWAAENLVVPDGPKAGEKWDPSLSPQLVEIVDQLAINSPTNLVAVRKSSQLGFTQAAMGWIGYTVDIAPAKLMLVMPTLDSARGFNGEKLSPTIEASGVLRSKVRRQVSRSAEGSTALTKRFRGGSIILTGANSSSDLASKTVRYAFGDEIERWPLDLDDQGDPVKMLEARQRAFLAAGTWKRLLGSTPVMKGGRTDSLFLAGDQRYWQVPCPTCGTLQKLEFFPDEADLGGLRFDTTFPHSAYYRCRAKGCRIEHWQKAAMVRAGRWVADAPGPGKYPSYHLDTLTSLLVGWDDIAAEFLATKDKPLAYKTFINLWLGQGWEERGDAPEWKGLYDRAEDYTACTVPPGGLVLTAGVDVQKFGVYYEVLAWGHNRVNWVIDAGYLEGETAEEDGVVWSKLDAVYRRQYDDGQGNVQSIELMAVDAAYATTQVYHFVRTRPRAMAIKGQPGWLHPAMGTPTKQDITYKGKKVRRGGAWLWPVGTWSLKAELYAELRVEGRKDGAEFGAPGYCHFGKWLDERYFQQLTAEYLKDKEVKGRKEYEWVATGENHFHDCRIYNKALAAHLHLSTMKPAALVAMSSKMKVAVSKLTDMVALMNHGVVSAAGEALEKTATAANAVRASVTAPSSSTAAPKKRRGVSDVLC